jgi:hypothetical protein
LWTLNQAEEIQAIVENAVCEEELACQLNLLQLLHANPNLAKAMRPPENHQMNFK